MIKKLIEYLEKENESLCNHYITQWAQIGSGINITELIKELKEFQKLKENALKIINGRGDTYTKFLKLKDILSRGGI